MFGGMKPISTAALVAAAMTLGGVSAQAADLGGNCCADLEERVAELEATTVRKGNRVMSLQLYGQVNRAFLWHDDDTLGSDDNVTFRDNDGRSGSRFGFRGQASVNADISIGFRLELGVDGDNGNGGVVGLRHQLVFVRSATLGTITFGQTSTATDGITEIALGGVITPFGSEEGGAVSAIAAAATPGVDGGRNRGVHYVSPTLAGFILSASYFHADADVDDDVDDDDMGFDVALRYAGEFGAFRVAAGVGYREIDLNGAGTDSFFGTSASILHTPTGLFLNGGYQTADFDAAGADFDGWNIQAGIAQNWFGLGTTTLAANYGENDFEAAGADSIYYGLGATQNIDAAATDLYLTWQRYELDAGLPVAGAGPQDDANVVQAGMRVRF